jgi:hypothetical protein
MLHVVARESRDFLVLRPADTGENSSACGCRPRTGPVRRSWPTPSSRGPSGGGAGARVKQRRKAFEYGRRAEADPVVERGQGAWIRGFGFVLRSGRERSVHIEQVLEYNKDPGHLRDVLCSRSWTATCAWSSARRPPQIVTSSVTAGCEHPAHEPSVPLEAQERSPRHRVPASFRPSPPPLPVRPHRRGGRRGLAAADPAARPLGPVFPM